MKKKRTKLLHTALQALAERTERIHCVSAVIAAAGSSVRFGSPKPFVRIDGKYLFEYSLDAFINSRYVAEVILAVRPEDQALAQKILSERADQKPVKLCLGGKTRFETTLRAFKACSDSTRLVAFHDAARPLIKTEQIEQVVLDALRYGAATAASAVCDSLKRVENRKITADVDRENVYAVSTPQIFLKDIYEVARAVCRADHFTATDDNAYVTHAGFDVHVTEVAENPKLTYPTDLALIERELIFRKGACK